MARTIEQIQNEIITAIQQEPSLSGLTSTSKVAIWRLLVYIFSVATWTLEKLFDNYKSEVNAYVAILKPHTLSWYHAKALAFQYGFLLSPETDNYDNTGVDQSLIDASLVVKSVAINESATQPRLIMKVAGETGGEFVPLDPPVIASFKTYIAKIKDAGIKITVINTLPDLVRLTIDVYYDPLVLTADGGSILYGGKPVEEAITVFFKNLDFNGIFILAKLTDALQEVEGVKIPEMILAESAWVDPNLNSYGNFTTISAKKIPESGYFKVVDFAGINYIPYDL